MGGRGTYAVGNQVAFNYETVGEIEGVKILEKLDKRVSGGLPEESHTSTAYIKVNKDGDFRKYREYDENHYLRFEIEYHPETNIDSSHDPVLHVHEYQPDDFKNRTTRALTKQEYEKYKKYFRGLIV